MVAKNRPAIPISLNDNRYRLLKIYPLFLVVETFLMSFFMLEICGPAKVLPGTCEYSFKAAIISYRVVGHLAVLRRIVPKMSILSSLLSS